jgi:NADH-quinone oxidoreductase subunit N
MLLNWSAIQGLFPEIFLLIITCSVLLLSTLKRKDSADLCYLLSQFGLLGAMALSVVLFFVPPMHTFNEHFILDPLAGLLKVFIYLTTFIALAYAKRYIQTRAIPAGEYYVLSLFSVFGMQVFVSAGSLLTLYLGLEILSLPIYALVAIERNLVTRPEAAMKYFVLGALASGLLLYGISFLYGYAHDLTFVGLAQAIGQTGMQGEWLVLFGLVFVLVGIAFKLGAVPFHMWVPDVYHGAPTSVTSFITSASKIAAMAFAIRLLHDVFPTLVWQWQDIIMIFAVLSIAVGNLAAIAQTNIKRMLAYSSIAHVGYLSLGLMLGTPGGFSSALFYMITYALMSLGAFGILLVLSYQNYDVEKIEDLQGLNTRHSWLAFLMLLLMFSMGGIPPFIGFIAKLNILREIILNGHIGLAAYALVFSVIGAYYYIRVVKVMYFEEPAVTAKPIVIAGLEPQIILGINGMAALFLGLFPGPLINLCRWVIG